MLLQTFYGGDQFGELSPRAALSTNMPSLFVSPSPIGAAAIDAERSNQTLDLIDRCERVCVVGPRSAVKMLQPSCLRCSSSSMHMCVWGGGWGGGGRADVVGALPSVQMQACCPSATAGWREGRGHSLKLMT